MSHRDVERVLGRLITDESLRGRFAADAAGTLGELREAGLELTPCEAEALAALPAAPLEELARALDPRLEKCDLGGPSQPSRPCRERRV